MNRSLSVAHAQKAMILGVEAFLLFLLLGAPGMAGAAGKIPSPPAASLAYPAFTELRASPIVWGTAENLRASLRLMVTDSTGSLWYAIDAATSSGPWSAQVYPSIPPGRYQMTLSSGTSTLYKGRLAVGVSAPLLSPDYSMGSFDVADGRLMRFSVRGGDSGTAIGQFTFALTPNNASVDTLTLFGFSDNTYSIPLGDGDGTVGTSSATDMSRVAVVPSSPIEIPAGVTYYFELDGVVSPADYPYSVTSTLLNDTAPFLIAGPLAEVASSSNFVWSPNTFGTSTPADADWLSSSAIVQFFNVGITMERFSTPTIGCNLYSSTSTISTPGPVTFDWDSVGAYRSIWDDGSIVGSFGEITVIASTTHNYYLTVQGSAGTDHCLATVMVVPIIVQVPPPPPSSATLIATPASGAAPLTTSMHGSVNTLKSCSASTYTLAFGDKSTTTIAVAKNLCKAVSYTLSHHYTAAGSYTAKLYAGTFSGTTMPPLQQSVQIAVTKKVALGSSSSMLAGVGAVLDFLQAGTRGVTAWLFGLPPPQ